MHKLRGLRGSLIVGIVGCVGAVGCERSIPQDPALNPNGAVVAQFDPANPIPLLNIVPSPTALAQKLTGGLNVPVDDCEKPSQKECLALAPGWPLSTPITLYFSGDIDPASIDAGIRLLEVSNGTMTPVPFMASVAPRDPPPEACGIDPAIVPPGVQVVLSPMAALKNDTQYMVAVISSPTKGLRDANMKPVMYAAVRRGLIMEELGRGSGDAELRGELFICGVFSLLDRLLQQPFATLLASVPVTERVQQALQQQAGPFMPYLELVQAIEQESVIDIRERADALMLGTAEVNRALLAALANAARLD